MIYEPKRIGELFANNRLVLPLSPQIGGGHEDGIDETFSVAVLLNTIENIRVRSYTSVHGIAYVIALA
jgi:hypothetical protein